MRKSRGNHRSNPPPPLPPAENLRAVLNSSFNQPPASYEYQPFDENRPQILAILEKHGLRPVSPKDHGASAGRIQEISGAAPTYYQGGDPRDTGFASGDLIFINAEREDIPTGWTMAHELVHVAQKDKRADAGAINQLFKKHLTPLEIAKVAEYVMRQGYSEKQLETELPAFMVADAVMGTEVIGFSEFKNGESLKQSLIDWFDRMPSLKPEIIGDIQDDEYARTGGLRTSDLPQQRARDSFERNRAKFEEAQAQVRALNKTAPPGRIQAGRWVRRNHFSMFFSINSAMSDSR